MPNQILMLFTTILVFGSPNNVHMLLHKYLDGMLKTWHNLPLMIQYSKAINDIKNQLSTYNKSIYKYCTAKSLLELGYLNAEYDDMGDNFDDINTIGDSHRLQEDKFDV